MCINDKIFIVLGQAILVFPFHEDGIPHIHARTTKHYIAKAVSLWSDLEAKRKKSNKRKMRQ
jgi:hypothetical protein